MPAELRHMVRFKRLADGTTVRWSAWHLSRVPLAICPVCARVIVRGRGEWWTRPLTLGEVLIGLGDRR